MKKLAYPVLFTKIKEGYYVTVPDFDAHTQGKDLADAISMARDLICLASIDLEDDGKTVPQPGQEKFTAGKKDLLSYVDVDLAAYRLKYGQKMVKKNCTIPLWLNEKAEALGINFSKVLQDALVQKLDA